MFLIQSRRVITKRGVKKIFLSSKVRSKIQQNRNLDIAEFCKLQGIDVFLPQTILERSPLPKPSTIVQINRREVDSSDCVIVILDNAGMGVAMELERAQMQNKLIIGLRSDEYKTKFMGSMLEGAWGEIKVTTDSYEILKKLIIKYCKS